MLGGVVEDVRGRGRTRSDLRNGLLLQGQSFKKKSQLEQASIKGGCECVATAATRQTNRLRLVTEDCEVKIITIMTSAKSIK